MFRLYKYPPSSAFYVNVMTNLLVNSQPLPKMEKTSLCSVRTIVSNRNIQETKELHQKKNISNNPNSSLYGIKIKKRNDNNCMNCTKCKYKLLAPYLRAFQPTPISHKFLFYITSPNFGTHLKEPFRIDPV